MKYENRGGTQMWCPNCKEITECAVVPLSSPFSGKTDGLTGQRLFYINYPDFKLFRRVRECQECNHQFVTAEVREELLDELVELRGTLVDLKKDVKQYMAESDESLLKLKKSTRAAYRNMRKQQRRK